MNSDWISCFLLLLLLGFFILLLLGFAKVSVDLSFGRGFISASDAGVFLSDDLSSDLKNYWAVTGDNEYSLCLNGDYGVYDEVSSDGANLLVYDLVSSSSFVEGDVNSVDFSLDCLDGFATVHKHPSVNGCSKFLNAVDAEAASTLFGAGNSLFLIQCDVDKLEVYTRDNLFSGVVVQFE